MLKSLGSKLVTAFGKGETASSNGVVLVEGGFQDEWWTLHVMPWRTNIPTNTTEIRITGNRLNLIGLLTSDGITPIVSSEQISVDFDPLFNPFQHIQRPRSIITDDFRVFSDPMVAEQGHLERLTKVVLEAQDKNTSNSLNFFQLGPKS